MIIKKKKFDKKNPCKSLPFDTVELSGFIEGGYVFYTRGHKTNCKSWPSSKIVFHTHVDLLPNNDIITLPDLCSPIDILVFLVTENEKMFIKTSRLFLTFEKTKATKRIRNKAISCIEDNKQLWKRMVDKNQQDRMCYYVLHFLRRGLHKKNRIWNLSWKRIVEQVFKIKVTIQGSTVKDTL